ncbi:hypothetical protein DAPPUDRAFT_101847 [Daphnia pulex]|uniref:Uncharacterized protein n=1 Tax=Daphnia pulex TaxID=6669 RepID=E9GEQ5_DAPPU|nr:hypothetical protein DAPPUDRAFT_101847 [Daphnia pulex]|eukprot:EFX81877.1 hypothetical protein DAPPUDRAFT_101847 [Daphnia pulex]
MDLPHMTIAGEWSVCCCCIHNTTQLRFRSKLLLFGGCRSDFSFRSLHPKRWNSRPTGSHDDESISKAKLLWGLQLDAAAAGTVIHSNSSQQLVAMGTARENEADWIYKFGSKLIEQRKRDNNNNNQKKGIQCKIGKRERKVIETRPRLGIAFNGGRPESKRSQGHNTQEQRQQIVSTGRCADGNVTSRTNT